MIISLLGEWFGDLLCLVRSVGWMWGVVLFGLVCLLLTANALRGRGLWGLYFALLVRG